MSYFHDCNSWEKKLAKAHGLVAIFASLKFINGHVDM